MNPDGYSIAIPAGELPQRWQHRLYLRPAISFAIAHCPFQHVASLCGYDRMGRLRSREPPLAPIPFVVGPLYQALRYERFQGEDSI